MRRNFERLNQVYFVRKIYWYFTWKTTVPVRTLEYKLLLPFFLNYKDNFSNKTIFETTNEVTKVTMKTMDFP